MVPVDMVFIGAFVSPNGQMPVTRRDLLGAMTVGTGAIAGCLTGGNGGTETETDTLHPETTTDTVTTTTETTTDSVTTDPSTTESATTEAGTTVVMQDRSFTPRSVSIAPGETVTWSNADTYGHDVTSTKFHDDAADWDLQTDTIGSGEEVSYTFEEAGVYEYYCTIHGEESMCGAVLVGDVTLPGDLPCSGGGYG